MPVFFSIHSFPAGAFTQEQMNQMGQMAQQDPVVRGHRSMANLQKGKAICSFEAPNEEALAQWFAKVGMPYDSIVQAELEGERGKLRRL